MLVLEISAKSEEINMEFETDITGIWAQDGDGRRSNLGR